VTGDIRVTGRIEVSGFELLNSASRGARTPRDHVDSGGGERVVGLGTTVAREQEPHVPCRHELGRLNAGPTAEREIGVLNSLEVEGVRINDQVVRAAAEPRVNVDIQRRLTSRDRDFH
jgi:hypothetical protein